MKPRVFAFLPTRPTTDHERGRQSPRRLTLEALEGRVVLAACDPTGDGVVNRNDIALIARNFGGGDGAFDERADCNRDGELNLYDVWSMQSSLKLPALDFGDAPDSYATLSTSNGAAHLVDPQYYLGAGVDTDSDGAPIANFGGDDLLDGNDDEDGVTFLTVPVSGTPGFVQVVASRPGFLNAWIDFNRNGVFDSSDRVFGAKQLSGGVNLLEVPAMTFFDGDLPMASRWRFTGENVVLAPDGAGIPGSLPLPGEVEDHLTKVADRGILDDWLVFPNSTFETEVQWTWGQTEQVTLRGSTAIHVQYEGPERGDANDHDGDGRDEVSIEIVAMQLSGMSSVGEIEMTLTTVRSLGEIEETGEYAMTDGRLNIPPFVDQGQAVASFALRPEIRILGQSINRPEPLHLTTWMDDNDSHSFRTVGEIVFDPLMRFLSMTYTPNLGYPFFPPELYDFGDAPDSYTTQLIVDGPRHGVTRNDLYLGRYRDQESNGWPSHLADGDDTLKRDDEDGITFINPVVPGATQMLEVTASGDGFLDGWVDFDRNGFWSANEQVFTSQQLRPNVNRLSFQVPADARYDDNWNNPTYARFRFSSAGGLAYWGLADDGEVEDYAYRIEPPPRSPEPAAASALVESRVTAADNVFAQHLRTNSVRAMHVARSSSLSQRSLSPIAVDEAVSTNAGGPDVTSRSLSTSRRDRETTGAVLRASRQRPVIICTADRPSSRCWIPRQPDPCDWWSPWLPVFPFDASASVPRAE